MRISSKKNVLETPFLTKELDTDSDTTQKNCKYSIKKQKALENPIDIKDRLDKKFLLSRARKHSVSSNRYSQCNSDSEDTQRHNEDKENVGGYSNKYNYKKQKVSKDEKRKISDYYHSKNSQPKRMKNTAGLKDRETPGESKQSTILCDGRVISPIFNNSWNTRSKADRYDPKFSNKESFNNLSEPKYEVFSNDFISQPTFSRPETKSHLNIVEDDSQKTHNVFNYPKNLLERQEVSKPLKNDMSFSDSQTYSHCVELTTGEFPVVSTKPGDHTTVPNSTSPKAKEPYYKKPKKNADYLTNDQ